MPQRHKQLMCPGRVVIHMTNETAGHYLSMRGAGQIVKMLCSTTDTWSPWLVILLFTLTHLSYM